MTESREGQKANVQSTMVYARGNSWPEKVVRGFAGGMGGGDAYGVISHSAKDYKSLEGAGRSTGLNVATNPWGGVRPRKKPTEVDWARFHMSGLS